VRSWYLCHAKLPISNRSDANDLRRKKTLQSLPLLPTRALPPPLSPPSHPPSCACPHGPNHYLQAPSTSSSPQFGGLVADRVTALDLTAFRDAADAPLRHTSHSERDCHLPLREGLMDFCIPPLLHRQFAFPDAFSVGGEQAQGKSAFTSSVGLSLRARKRYT
jgi:hypothetical protein